MKVLFVPSDNNSTSGAFRSMAFLNRLLNEEHNMQTLVVLPSKEGTGVELLDSLNIKYTFIDSYNWIIKSDRDITQEDKEKIEKEKLLNNFAIKKFVELIKKENIDIVHINTTYSYVAAIAGYITRTPVVWHLREFLEEDQKRQIYDKQYGYSIIGKATRIITISDALYKKYESILPKEKLQVIYNGIDERDFYKPEKSILNNPEKYIFACAGAVNYNKGQDCLIKACGLLKRRGIDNFELLLAGKYDERYRKIMMDLAHNYNIENNVKLLGPRNDVKEIFEKADISFMCSKFEAFGRTTVEAMMSGALVIGANTGGTVEIINDMETGLLYEQGNADDLCKKIQYALKHPEEMKTIAATGRKMAMQKYTAKLNASNIVNVYNDVLLSFKKAEVIAVIVTYNRLNMLKQCVNAVLNQSYKSLDLVIVDNASTDGTEGYVKSLKEKRIKYIKLKKNEGGAGGFHRGIKEAYIKGAKWIWVMDDDVIPDKFALDELMKATTIPKKEASFFASTVMSMDNKAMNTPGIDLRSKNGYPYWYEYLDKGLVKINAATFVSILVNANAVAKCGLPCKDFFIWGDDTEYTKRIYKNFGEAFFVGKSKVVHMRKGSAALSLMTETDASRVGMYYYFIRNTLTFTEAYASQEAFQNKLKLFRKNIMELKKSQDPLKKEKIDIINRGIHDYLNKKYDYNAFENRMDVFYETKTGEESNKKGKKKNLFIRGYKCLKDNGIKYTMKRIVYKIRNNQL